MKNQTNNNNNEKTITILIIMVYIYFLINVNVQTSLHVPQLILRAIKLMTASSVQVIVLKLGMVRRVNPGLELDWVEKNKRKKNLI